MFWLNAGSKLPYPLPSLFSSSRDSCIIFSNSSSGSSAIVISPDIVLTGSFCTSSFGFSSNSESVALNVGFGLVHLANSDSPIDAASSSPEGVNISLPAVDCHLPDSPVEGLAIGGCFHGFFTSTIYIK